MDDIAALSRDMATSLDLSSGGVGELVGVGTGIWS